MKLLIVSLFIAAVAADPLGESPRITGGYSARSGLAKCYVSIVIPGTVFKRTCGGCLIVPDNKIVTSASCVFFRTEGEANKLQFYNTLSGPSGSPQNWQVVDIYKPAGFDYYVNTSANDVAVILLKDRVRTSSTFASAFPSTEDKEDAFVGEDLVVCGHGHIDNNRTEPGSKGLQCTTLKVVPLKECMSALVPKPAINPKGSICTKNNDDRNVCGGDQGSPVFSNMTGQLQFVGVVSYYPNARRNAPCRDGHYAVITQLGTFQKFIDDPQKYGA
jgi:secreted trypsin-like serine protease